MGINFDRPKYPSYAILAVRISSYTDWPAAMTQTPRDMALAGFFYAGYGDYTRCFFCGGGLRNWEAGDDPWVEHARWFKKCAFLRQKKGQEFVDLVQKRAAELDGDGNKEEMENSQITISTSGPRSTQANEENVMRSQAVTTIKRMGYSEGKIKAAIHTIKSTLPREEQKVSAQEILEVIFELNQSVPATHVGQSERVPNNCTNSTNHSVSASENTAHHIIQSDPAPEGNLNSTNEDASAMDDFNAELISLKQENSSLKDQILCKICMDEKVSIAFLPCGHLACCEDCAPAMRKCPICREFVGHYLDAILVLPS
uniref:Putative inhibitor of apoptosis n=1 Tax=Magallana gigas TaxID=29159 RepID=K1R0S8_MAGGI